LSITFNMAVRKKRAAHKCNPFSELGVLQRVLEYVGAGQCLFIALVSHQWKQLYEKVADCTVKGVDDDTAAGFVEFTCTSTTTLASAAFASTQRVRLAHECGLNLKEGTFSLQFIAGKYGDKKVLALLRELQLPFTSSVVCGAAAAPTGSLAKVKWLHKEHRCELTSDVADYAAGSGNLAVLKYLHSEECEFGLDATYNAAAAGHIHVLEHLQHCCPWNAEACNAAAAGGHLAALRFLREHQCPWDTEEIAVHAAESDSIPLMQYVVQQGAVLTAAVALTAVQYGHLALCKHLVAISAPVNVQACSSAARSGSAELLRLLHRASSPWDAEDTQEVCRVAAKGGSVDILNYLVNEAEVELDADILMVMLNVAGAYEQLAAAQWCRQRGAEWPSMLRFFSPWEGATLAWARAEGCNAPTVSPDVDQYDSDNFSDDDDDDDDGLEF
jgi:hypothetical protein